MAVNTRRSSRRRSVGPTRRSRFIARSETHGEPPTPSSCSVRAEDDAATAQQLYEESVRVFRELGDEHSALLATRNLASNYAGLATGNGLERSTRTTSVGHGQRTTTASRRARWATSR